MRGLGGHGARALHLQGGEDLLFDLRHPRRKDQLGGVDFQSLRAVEKRAVGSLCRVTLSAWGGVRGAYLKAANAAHIAVGALDVAPLMRHLARDGVVHGVAVVAEVPIARVASDSSWLNLANGAGWDVVHV
jgi:hypothetical protein